MKLTLLVATGLLATSLAPTGSAGARAEKVDVCHNGDDGWEQINIAEQAFPAHIEHGDAGPGEPVPGSTTGEIFDDSCVPVAPPPPPPNDLCPNLDGVQDEVPPGYQRDDLGRCITIVLSQPYTVSNCRFDDASKTSGLADITASVGLTGEWWATWQLDFVPNGPFGPLPFPSPGQIGTQLDPGGEPFEVAVLDFPWQSLSEPDLAPVIAWGHLQLFLDDGTRNELTQIGLRAEVPRLCGATLPR